MKKTVAILLIAVMALSFVACSLKSKIVGTWKVTDSTDQSSNNMVMTFSRDGKLTIEGIFNGTYSVKGDKVTIRVLGEEETYKASINGDTMTWKGEDETLTFTKQ